jgi:hypothetical protein
MFRYVLTQHQMPLHKSNIIRIDFSARAFGNRLFSLRRRASVRDIRREQPSNAWNRSEQPTRFIRRWPKISWSRVPGNAIGLHGDIVMEKKPSYLAGRVIMIRYIVSLNARAFYLWRNPDRAPVPCAAITRVQFFLMPGAGPGQEQEAEHFPPAQHQYSPQRCPRSSGAGRVVTG